jgi:hypothetical protein
MPFAPSSEAEVRRSIDSTTSSIAKSPMERLCSVPLQRLLVTDSVTAPTDSALPLHVTRLDARLAETIRRLHGHLSLHDLLVHE